MIFTLAENALLVNHKHGGTVYHVPGMCCISPLPSISFLERTGQSVVSYSS